MSDEQAIISFVVFCLEAYKRVQDISGEAAAALFVRHGVTGYLRDGYDVLHTLGEQALVEDIGRYLDCRGGGAGKA